MRESVFISVIDPEGRINKSEIPVQNTRTISLGREMGTNTVQLPFRFVSGRHGEITFEGNKIYYRDLNNVETNSYRKSSADDRTKQQK